MDGLKWTPTLIGLVVVVYAASVGCSDDAGSGGSSPTGGSADVAGSATIGGTPAGSGGAASTSAGTSASAGTGVVAGTGSGLAGSSTSGGSQSETGPRGAVSLNVATGPGCKLPAGVIDIPVVAGGHPVSAAGATNPIADNTSTPEGLVRVTCAIQGGLAHGEIRNERTGQIIEVVSGFPTPKPELSGLLGTIVAAQPNYSGTDANPCPLTLLQSTSTSFLVKVNCPTFVPGDGSDGTCVLNESYAYFEGCTN